jgi:hypothetical protein
MNVRGLLTAFLNATNTQQVETALAAYLTTNPGAGFQPVGRRPNNRGAIEVASDAGRSLVPAAGLEPAHPRSVWYIGQGF